MDSSFPLPSPCPLIEVSGTARDRGRQYGEQAAKRIALGIDLYTSQLESRKIGWPEIRKIVVGFQPAIDGFDSNYLEEMRGIAEGAKVEFEAIVMLNVRTEVLKLAGRNTSADQRPEDTDGCTSLVILPGAAARRQVIHAQNWDWKAECADTAVVLKVIRVDGPDFLTFTEAGGLARSGINAAGISITANYLESDRDYRTLGVPLALLRRKVLEQQHLAAAMHTVYATPKSAANNMMISHATGIAIDFECAPDETFLVYEKGGIIVHANHFQSPVALTKLRDTGIANTPDSLYRDLRVRSLLEPHIGSVTKDHVKNALFDDFETPWSICRPPRRSAEDDLSATVAQVVMEPDQGTIEITMLPALNTRFERYRIDMEVRQPASTKERVVEA